MKILLSSLIPAVICSYLITVSAYGQGGDNPALADLNAAVTYYWSFDSENTEADLTEKELSIKPEGTPVFDSGKFGKGLRIGPTQGGRTILNFPENPLNINAAVAFWVTAVDWIPPEKSDERGSFHFIRLRGPNNAMLFIQRLGFRKESKRPDSLNVGIIRQTENRDIYIYGKIPTLDWKPYSWHLVVLNIERDKIGISVDGSTFLITDINRAAFNLSFPADKPLTVELGHAVSEITHNELTEISLIDELIIFKRTLNENEVKTIFQKSGLHKGTPPTSGEAGKKPPEAKPTPSAKPAAPAKKPVYRSQGKAYFNSDTHPEKDSLYIETGLVAVRFASKMSWTIRETSFNEKNVLTNLGFLQSVLFERSVPQGVDAYLGSGHRPEKVESIEIDVFNNDKKIGTYPVNEDLRIDRGNIFIVRKKSKFISEYLGPLLDHSCEITVSPDGLDEIFSFTVTGAGIEKIENMYPIMHIFPVTTKFWKAADATQKYSGTFLDDNSWSLMKDIRYAFIYDPHFETGTVYVYPEIYKGYSLRNGFWNRKMDNKLYYMIDPRIYKPGQSFSFSVSLRFFESPQAGWEQKAESTLKTIYPNL